MVHVAQGCHQGCFLRSGLLHKSEPHPHTHHLTITRCLCSHRHSNVSNRKKTVSTPRVTTIPLCPGLKGVGVPGKSRQTGTSWLPRGPFTREGPLLQKPQRIPLMSLGPELGRTLPLKPGLEETWEASLSRSGPGAGEGPPTGPPREQSRRLLAGKAARHQTCAGALRNKMSFSTELILPEGQTFLSLVNSLLTEQICVERLVWTGPRLGPGNAGSARL